MLLLKAASSFFKGCMERTADAFKSEPNPGIGVSLLRV